MIRRLSIVSVLLILGLSGSAWAQYGDDYKIEITPFVGYTLSEGVPVQPIDVGGGKTVNGLNPTSALSWGFQVDLLPSENFGIGFLYSDQQSELEGELAGGGKEIFADMNVRNYHGVFTYNVGEADAPMRPYFFGGLGATQYDPGDYQGAAINGETRFSTTWGGGVKIYPSDNLGFRLGARWTPTYINSSSGGIWCGPYVWGCWVIDDPNYSNQFELSGGVAIRF